MPPAEIWIWLSLRMRLEYSLNSRSFSDCSIGPVYYPYSSSPPTRTRIPRLSIYLMKFGVGESSLLKIGFMASSSSPIDSLSLGTLALIGGHGFPCLKVSFFRTSSISFATKTPKGPWLLALELTPLAPFCGVYPRLISLKFLSCGFLFILKPPPTLLPLLLLLLKADGV